MPELTHLDERGEARMVDVGQKDVTVRVAIDRGHVKASSKVLEALAGGQIEKGDVLAAARIAGIMAAKRTPELIPLCHAIALSSVKVDLQVDAPAGEIRITAEARARDRTGVEMEALTAVSVAALTVYDMLKAVDRTMQIGGIELVEKQGGRSGHFLRPLQVVPKTPQPSAMPPPDPMPAQMLDHGSVPPRPMALTEEIPVVRTPGRRPVSDAARARARLARAIDADDPRLPVALRRDPVEAAYMLGDLDGTYAEHCRWYAIDEAELGGVLLLYSGLSVPTLLSHGAPLDIEALVEAVHDELPRRFYCHLHADHRDALLPRFELADMKPMIRMGLVAEDYHPQGESARVERLTHRDTGAIMQLYRHYPDNFFEPAQLDTGLYFGVRQGDELLSVAGIHVFSQAHDIAAIGNIVTHSGHRAGGLATLCVGRLLDDLFQHVNNVALNVQADNTAAIRCYRKFGFREHFTFYEGRAIAR
ncbi:MAG: cyclic pyranopterin monophosphate synthase MoaC [Myxococcales bacterium]|nr:cyclic pyranopterin monophosphate synthase MoaC [Myxococcales bacterium]